MTRVTLLTSLRMNLFTLLLETLCKNQRPKMKLNTGIKHTLLQFQCKQSVVTYWAITSSNKKAKELARWTALYLVAKQPKSKKYNNVNDVMLPSPFQLLPKQDDDHQLLKSHSLYRRGLPSKMLEHTWAQKASHHFVREVEHEDFHCSAEDHSEVHSSFIRASHCQEVLLVILLFFSIPSDSNTFYLTH